MNHREALIALGKAYERKAKLLGQHGAGAIFLGCAEQLEDLGRNPEGDGLSFLVGTFAHWLGVEEPEAPRAADTGMVAGAKQGKPRRRRTVLQKFDDIRAEVPGLKGVKASDWLKEFAEDDAEPAPPAKPKRKRAPKGRTMAPLERDGLLCPECPVEPDGRVVTHACLERGVEVQARCESHARAWVEAKS